MTKLNNSNFDKLKNSNTQNPKNLILKRFKQILIVNKMSKTQKLEFGPNSTESLTNLKTQILMKFTYSYCDKNQKLTFWYKKSIPYKSLKLKTTGHLDKQWDILRAAFWYFAMFFKHQLDLFLIIRAIYQDHIEVNLVVIIFLWIQN